MWIARLHAATIAAAFLVALPGGARAANIDPLADGSALAWSENLGWMNFAPSDGPGVEVSDTGVVGLAWGENVGWIALDPPGGGVWNDGTGVLSGYAWGENIGWIDFAPTGGGVTINACGEFGGSAWGENAGWIRFRSEGPNAFRVVTSWTSPIDDVAPVTELTTPLPEWLVSDASLTFDATDCGVGVQEIHVEVDGSGDVVTPGSSAGVTVTGEGLHLVDVYAVDLEGNMETLSTFLVQIDGTPPTIDLRVPEDSSQVPINTPLTADFIVNDAVSGLASVTSTAPDGSSVDTSIPGAASFEVSATDFAGNTSVVSHDYEVFYPGNLDPAGDGSHWAWAENVGWIDMRPPWGPGVTVENTVVAGMAWAENAGWIRFDPPGAGVVNAVTGALSGHAWGENVGWIDFAPTGGGVAIDPLTGEWSGLAWGENVGWIRFSASAGTAFGVTTGWRAPQCANGIDDDGDGQIDGADSLCTGLEDDGEAPACSDGVDRDGDQLADWPDDPGCDDALDDDEHSAALPCDDGIDGDGDGAVDWPDDPGCASPTDATETDPATPCDDGVDNDGDGFVDVAQDAGCSGVEDSSEQDPSLVCDDGVDNDGDTLIDFPADPGCLHPRDLWEQNPNAACDNGMDDDADGATDYPNDPDCEDPLGSIEFSVRAGDVLVTSTADGGSIVKLDPVTGEQSRITSGGELSDPRHLALASPRDLYAADSGSDAVVHIDLGTGSQTLVAQGNDLKDATGIVVESDGNLVVTDRGVGFNPDPEVMRVVPATGATSLLADLPTDDVQGAAVRADGSIFVGAEDTESILLVNPGGGYSIWHSSFDFDATGVAVEDSGDVVAANSFAGEEGLVRVTGSSPPTVLWSGPAGLDPEQIAIEAPDTVLVVDRAGNRVLRVDVATGTDSTLSSAGLLSEPVGLAIVPTGACADGLDDDGDGLTDWPDDPGCADAEDDSERDPLGPACDNGADDDADTFFDYPDDLGCASAYSAIEDPQCSDGDDNDNDGLTDGADPHCSSPADNKEGTPTYCGLGPELALLLPLLGAIRKRPPTV